MSRPGNTQTNPESTAGHPPAGGKPVKRGEDAIQLLKAGIGLLAAGILAAALVETVFGGISQHGPHTNGGWILLIVTMACLPLGVMLSLLGGAKWLGNRRR